MNGGFVLHQEVHKLAMSSAPIPEHRLQTRLGMRLHRIYQNIFDEKFGFMRKKEDAYLNYCKVFEKHAGELTHICIYYAKYRQK